MAGFLKVKKHRSDQWEITRQFIGQGVGYISCSVFDGGFSERLIWRRCEEQWGNKKGEFDIGGFILLL